MTGLKAVRGVGYNISVVNVIPVYLEEKFQ